MLAGTPEAAERNYLLDVVIKPLMIFSVKQEATTADERLRAAALVAKIDAFNATVARKKRRFLGLFGGNQ